jgi:outer membrane protein OmpA-like peptidoglycan-associated protein
LISQSRGLGDVYKRQGMRRAKAVADILIKRFGISADRINIKSNGKRSIRFQNSDELNRRVDISIQ